MLTIVTLSVGTTLITRAFKRNGKVYTIKYSVLTTVDLVTLSFSGEQIMLETCQAGSFVSTSPATIVVHLIVQILSACFLRHWDL